MTIKVLDDSEWFEVPDPEWKAAEAEYEGVNANYLVSKGIGDIMVVSNSEWNKWQIIADESIASDTPSSEIEDVWTRDGIVQPIPRAEDKKNPDLTSLFIHWLFLELTCKYLYSVIGSFTSLIWELFVLLYNF